MIIGPRIPGERGIRGIFTARNENAAGGASGGLIRIVDVSSWAAEWASLRALTLQARYLRGGLFRVDHFSVRLAAAAVAGDGAGRAAATGAATSAAAEFAAAAIVAAAPLVI